MECSSHLPQGLHLGCPTLGLLQTNGEISNAGPKQYIWSALAKMSSLLSTVWDCLFTCFLLSFHTCQNHVVVSWCADTSWSFLISLHRRFSPIQSLIRPVLSHVHWRTLTNTNFCIFPLSNNIFNFLGFEIIIYNFYLPFPSSKPFLHSPSFMSFKSMASFFSLVVVKRMFINMIFRSQSSYST